MAFKIFQWLTKSVAGDPTKVTGFLDEAKVEKAGIDVWLKIMAFNACVSRIAAAVGSCEFETYSKGSLDRKDEYWKWNIEPNPNQNKREFFEKMIFTLYSNEEAMIVKSASGSYFVADSYSTINGDITGDRYENVVIGSTTLNQYPYSSKEVIKLKLEGGGIKTVLNGIADAEANMIETARASYIRNSGRHGILNISDTASADKDFEEKYRKLVNEKFGKYFLAENAVLPLFDGYKYTPDSGNTSGTEPTSINDMLKRSIELTAAELGVPASIAKMEGATDADFDAFMTYTIKPIVEMLQTEINRKIYGQSLMRNDSYMRVDMAPVKYSDLFGLANGIDKLISSGCFSINDILSCLSLKTINELWADQHWMTKNYSPADQLLEAQGGRNET